MRGGRGCPLVGQSVSIRDTARGRRGERETGAASRGRRPRRRVEVADQSTFCTRSPIPSVTRSPRFAAVSTTAPAARRTRFTAPLLPPSVLPPPPLDAAPRFDDDRFAEARFAEERFAVERFADDFFADDFFAVDRLLDERLADERLADDFFAVDFFADDRFAEDFFAVERLADERFAEPADERLLELRFVLVPPRDDDEDARFDAPPDDLRAEDFFADDLRPDDLRAPPVFDAAEAPDARVRRRAVPLLRPEDLLFDVLPEDFERVAIRELLC